MLDVIKYSTILQINEMPQLCTKQSGNPLTSWTEAVLKLEKIGLCFPAWKCFSTCQRFACLPVFSSQKDANDIKKKV